MQFQNTLWVSAQTPKRIARFCTHAAPAGAFSLIELMVVLALIAIMTALIVPQMKGTFDEALLRSTARQLVDALSLASSRAVTLNHPHLVRVDRNNGRYIVEEARRAEQSDNPLPPGRKAAAAQGTIDTRISIEIRKASEEPPDGAEPATALPSGDELRNGKPDQTITFYSDGTAEAAEITLADPEGFRVSLRINPVTARAQIIELKHQ